MNRSALNKIIQEELANLTTEAVPSNIQSFANRKGADAKRLVRQVDGWATKVGKRITGGTAIGKNYDTLVLDLTHQGGEIYINLSDESIEVHGEPVTNFKEFEMAVMNPANEAVVKEATNKWNESDFPIGAIAHMDDEQWKVVKPGSRNGKIFMMPFNREAKDRHVSIAIEFDLNWLNTEVDTINEAVVSEASIHSAGDILVHDRTGEEVVFQSHISPIKMAVKDAKGKQLIVSPMYYTLKEGTVKEAVEYVDKDSPESKIVVRGFGNYITLMQTDFDDRTTTTFVVGTEQIAELIKVLNKFK